MSTKLEVAFAENEAQNKRKAYEAACKDIERAERVIEYLEGKTLDPRLTVRKRHEYMGNLRDLREAMPRLKRNADIARADMDAAARELEEVRRR